MLDMSVHLVPMIYEFVISAFCLYFVILIGMRYKERRKPVVKYLFLFGVWLTAAILIAAVSRILRYTGVWILNAGPPEKKLELLALTVSFIAFSDIFLTAFILEVFRDGAMTEENKRYIAIVGVFSGIFAAFAVVTGIFTEDLTDLIWLLLILLSAPIYVLLIRSSFKLAARLEDNLMKTSMKLIGIGGISILMVFIFFMIDAAVGGAYSPFYYIAWVFAVLSVVMLYIGVISPDWFKERFKEE